MRQQANARWLSLSLSHTHTHARGYVILIAFPRNNGIVNALQCYVTRTLSVLSVLTSADRQLWWVRRDKLFYVTTMSEWIHTVNICISTRLTSLHQPVMPSIVTIPVYEGSERKFQKRSVSNLRFKPATIVEVRYLPQLLTKNISNWTTTASWHIHLDSLITNHYHPTLQEYNLTFKRNKNKQNYIKSDS
jgi:hypothetical protein